MRSLRFSICSVLIISGLLALSMSALAAPPRTNLRFSIGVWDTPDTDVGINVTHKDIGHNERITNVDVSGLSGSFAISHQINRRFAWELSFGGFSDTDAEVIQEKVERWYHGDYYETIYSYSHTVSVNYVTMGLIYYPMSELDDTLGDLTSFFRPYLTAGIGPYFGWDVRWDNDDLIDADLTTIMGAYPGIGVDLLLSRHFLLNFDLRYHLIEFGEPLKGIEDFSGLNALFGFKVAF